MADAMREALRAAYLAGSQYGHEATVEGRWSNDPETADDYLSEALAQKPAQGEAVADVNEKMRDALVAYRYVQRKMLEKWSEGDARVKAGLWAALHKCEDLADAALAEQPAQGEAFGWCRKTDPAFALVVQRGEPDDRDREVCGDDLILLYTAPPAPSVSVPEGWKLVPVEPSMKMIRAFNEGRPMTLTDADVIKRRYAAMLAAAPEVKP